MRFREIISEEVFGGAAIVYHRTKTIENISSIENHGYVPGDGDAYGEGIYATYDFGSQQRPEMLKYGPYIVKNKLHLQGFAIFDEDVAKNVYGAKWRMADQCRMFGIPDGSHWDKQISRAINPPSWEFAEAGFTSRAAFAFSRDSTVWEHRNSVKGLAFTGKQDGRVVVAYDPSALVPYAYTTSTREMLAQAQTDFEWTPLDVRQATRRRVGGKSSAADRALTMWTDVNRPVREDMSMFKWFLRNWANLPAAQSEVIVKNLVDNSYRFARTLNVQALMTADDRTLLANLLHHYPSASEKLSPLLEEPDTSFLRMEYPFSDADEED